MAEALTFGSQEQMIAWMQEQREARDRRAEMLAPKQEELTWGSYWVRFLEGLVIFGRVMTEEELAEEEDDAPDHFERLMRRGTMWSLCYSALVVDGEWGSVDKAIVWPINKATFERAKAYHFDTNRVPEWTAFDLTTAFEEFRRHARSVGWTE